MVFERGRLASTPIAKEIFVLILALPFCLCAIAQAQGEVGYADGTPFLHRLLDEANSWSDYSCLTEMHNIKPHSITVTHTKLIYKKGPQVRIEIQGGFRHGTVLARNAEGKCSGRGGFFLGGIPIKIEPNSNMLNLPSGYNALRADFPETYAEMKELVGKGYMCKYTPEPVEDSELGKKVVLLELYAPDRFMTEKVYLSPDEKHLPLRWDSLKEGRVKSKTWFRNMKINTGVKDQLFKL